DYGTDYTLTENGASVKVIISNNSDNDISGVLRAESDRKLSFSETKIFIPAFDETEININVYSDDKVIWNKNLINLLFETDKGEIFRYTTGVSGAHVWKVYGPYWDYYNKDKFDFCPFRNEKDNYNPCAGPDDCPDSMFHFFTSLKNEYLDEKRLFKEDIEEEEPFVLNCEDDMIGAEDLDLKMNETCVYFTGNIIFDKPTDVVIFIGANAPFVLYIDGEKKMECSKYGSSAPHDNAVRGLTMGTEPKRFVIKALKPNKDFRFEMHFTNTDWAATKEEGISYLFDNFGFVID
ncbi:MAG: hypothetical protein KBT47_00315, partial [Armatimonadetes bacterium]|nr:hypothetical protein [Candidatus Hippobium faecium]